MSQMESRWDKPAYEVLVEIGFAHGAMQLARMEHKGRSTWKTRKIAEKHAADFTAWHGKIAYVSEV